MRGKPKRPDRRAPTRVERALVAAARCTAIAAALGQAAQAGAVVSVPAPLIQGALPGARMGADIIVSGVLARQRAPFALLEIAGKTMIVKVGDVLPGGDVVQSIAYDRVVFRAHRALWTLAVADRSASRMKPRLDQAASVEAARAAPSAPSPPAPSTIPGRLAGSAVVQLPPTPGPPAADDIWAIPTWLAAGQSGPPPPVFDPAILKSPWGK